MLNFKLTKTNAFNKTSLTASNLALGPQYNEKTWINIINCKSATELTTAYKSILSSISSQNKWTLMVNPEVKMLEKMSLQSTINSAKILKVNAHKIKINIDNIVLALRTGNCSSVILCDPKLTQKELASLEIAAKKGNTRCTIIHSEPTIH